jgi:hypothetical protein
MPVLAIGAAESTGEGVTGALQRVEADVQSVVLADRGRWVAEQAPAELLAALTAFGPSATGGRQGVGEGERRRRPSTASVRVIEDTSIRPEGDPDV